MLKNNDGPAFPQHKNGVGGQTIASEGGMTLRDYFAGQALVAVLLRGIEEGEAAEDVTEACYGVADAMIAARGSDND